MAAGLPCGSTDIFPSIVIKPDGRAWPKEKTDEFLGAPGRERESGPFVSHVVAQTVGGAAPCYALNPLM